MSFPSLPYLEFATQNYASPRYDLASSNLPLKDLNEIEIDRQMLALHPSLLMKKFIEILSERYKVAPDQIALTSGGTSAIAALSSVLSDSQHTFYVCESPYYEPFKLTPAGFGTKVEFIQRQLDDKQRMILSRTQLEKTYQQKSKPRALWLTNPHNPSGTLIDHANIKSMAQLMEEWSGHLVVNEIYLDFAAPMGQKSVIHLNKNIIVCTSLTKAYGLGHLRLGWIIASEPVISQVKSFVMHTCGMLSGPSLAYGLSVLNNIDELRKGPLAELELKKQWLSSHFKSIDQVQWYQPEYGIVGLLKLKNIRDDISFSQKLHKATGVIVAPCSFFDLPGHLRVSFGLPMDKLKEGAKILSDFIVNYRE